MNVYDFDETVFVGDSEDLFNEFLYAQGYVFVRLKYKVCQWLFKKRLLTKTQAREAEYKCALAAIRRRGENLDELLEKFWDGAEKNLMPWYLEAKKPTDIIASGTPRFIMEPIVRRLGLGGLVATDMDTVTGRCLDGKFAVAEAKLEAFRKQYDPKDVDAFYSDAYSDHFLADECKKAYVIYDKDHKQMEWNAFFETHPEKKVIAYKR